MSGQPGLYVHIPFCSAICPYCDFAVTVGKRDRRIRFVESLLDEIGRVGGDSSDDPLCFPHAFDTVYFGGGTPSALDPDDLARIVDALRRSFAIAHNARIHLEANPEDVTDETAEAWRRLGVEFLSLGIQSLDDTELRFLGRRHRAEDARLAFEVARAAGFATLSVDLIFGMPGHDTASWEKTLRDAASLEPDHVSCYQLTIHEGTHFARRREQGRLDELPDEGQADLFETTHRVLAASGFAAYEVSNFARGRGHESRHNRKYWDHTPYLGLGPSSHSLEGNRRWWNVRDLPEYEREIAAGRRPVAGSEELGPSDLALEALMLGLRTSDGVDLDRLAKRHGLLLRKRNAAVIDRMSRDGLLRDEGTRLVATVRGWAIADALARAFDLADAASSA